MPVKFVTRTIHAYLDYPVALAPIVLPFVPGLGAACCWLNGAAVVLVIASHKPDAQAVAA